MTRVLSLAASVLLTGIAAVYVYFSFADYDQPAPAQITLAVVALLVSLASAGAKLRRSDSTPEQVGAGMLLTVLAALLVCVDYAVGVSSGPL